MISTKSDNMARKTYLYEWQKEEFENLTDIEKEAFKKADRLNDMMLDIKILMDEIDEEWSQYMKYLEDSKISRICEFRGGQCIEFDEELLNAIVNTLKKSLNDTKNSLNHNSKKINLNRVIDG